jgi:hypothetical protein
MITVVGPRDPIPNNDVVINTTSRSNDWGVGLSPFLNGPVWMYDKILAQNIENAWQYSKVYDIHTSGPPHYEMLPSWWDWARAGWSSKRAVRYPFGKGAKPLYSYWNGYRLGYIQARKFIYIPLYAQAVWTTPAFQKLQKLYDQGKNICLWDFDGYLHHQLGMTLEDVVECPNRTMGHAFVLAMMLERRIEVSYEPANWKFELREAI